MYYWTISVKILQNREWTTISGRSYTYEGRWRNVFTKLISVREWFTLDTGPMIEEDSEPEYDFYTLNHIFGLGITKFNILKFGYEIDNVTSVSLLITNNFSQPLLDFIVFYLTNTVWVNWIFYLYFYNLDLDKFYKGYCLNFSNS